MRIHKRRLRGCSSGQALLETALILPMLLALIFNAINFGYFFLVALNLSAAPRSGVEYAIQGFATPGASVLATAASVNTLTGDDLTGALNAGSTAPVQVCSKVIGLTNAGTPNQRANCLAFNGGGTFPALDSDPESPSFVLHRVHVIYVFRPIIPGRPFNIALLPAAICTAGVCTFHRQVSMRAMD